MSERDGYGDSDGAPDCIPPRASRGRRSGVILPGGGGQDSDTILLESVKAAPRRSSIIKVNKAHMLLALAQRVCYTHAHKEETKFVG